MQRRTPLKRTPLARPTYEQVIAAENRRRAKAKPLARGKAPKRIGRRAKREQAALDLGRAQVLARSGGFCEGPALPGVHPSYRHGAVHVHHLLPRGRGGKHDPSNLLHLCAPAHAWIDDFPKEAEKLGLLMPSRAVSSGVVSP